MSTHASISTLNLDGSVTSVYCHYDGYLGHVGITLKNYYTTQTIVDDLLMFGDIQCLREGVRPDPNQRHDMFMHQQGVTTFYCRDGENRGMSYCGNSTKTYEDFAEYIARGCSEEYNYIFVDGVWTYCTDSHLGFKHF